MPWYDACLVRLTGVGLVLGGIGIAGAPVAKHLNGLHTPLVEWLVFLGLGVSVAAVGLALLSQSPRAAAAARFAFGCTATAVGVAFYLTEHAPAALVLTVCASVFTLAALWLWIDLVRAARRDAPHDGR